MQSIKSINPRATHEDAHDGGFYVERNKRRNLLNSAGSSSRPGTLAHRVNVRVEAENDNARNARMRARGIVTKATTRALTIGDGTNALKVLRHDVGSIAAWLLDHPSFDAHSIIATARMRAMPTHDTPVSMGAGRGW